MQDVEDKTYRSDAEAEALVRRFEAGELPPAEFRHAAHLTVALWYASRLPEGAALDAMRRSILNYLGRRGLGAGVYHETLTAFWMRRVGAFRARSDRALPFFRAANELIEECGDPRLVYDYYSKDSIASGAARARLVGPDLRPLDF